MKKLDIELTPYCCRHTCISMLVDKEVDPTYIKLVGNYKGKSYQLSFNRGIFPFVRE